MNAGLNRTDEFESQPIVRSDAGCCQLRHDAELPLTAPFGYGRASGNSPSDGRFSLYRLTDLNNSGTIDAPEEAQEVWNSSLLPTGFIASVGFSVAADGEGRGALTSNGSAANAKNVFLLEDKNGDGTYLQAGETIVLASNALDSTTLYRPRAVEFYTDPTPVISSNGGDTTATVTVAENRSAVTTVQAFHGNTATADLRYAISGGADAALFAIDSVSGALSFLDAPNFENPQDTGHDNVYDVAVSVSDGQLGDTQALAIRVIDVNEAPPVSTDPSTGPDLLTGTSGSDAISAGAGNDTINSGSGNDLVFGGDGADQITSTPAAGEKAQVYGGSGFLDPNDAGDAILVTGGGSAEIYGNGGDDAIAFRADGAGTIFTGVGNDRVTVVNKADNAVTGGPGADTITISGNGSNLVVGGTGITDPSDSGDTVRIVGNGNNTVYASGGDDVVTITGSGNNTVFGGVGKDTMSGGSGNDVLVGGPGDNVYTGGGGADRFVHTTGARDIVTDFSFAQGDHLDLGGQAYTLTSASDGAAALAFSDGGVVILQGITQAGFQSGFIA